MARGFDELVNFLLDEVALRFAEGKSIKSPASRRFLFLVMLENYLRELGELVSCLMRFFCAWFW
jgi:hypothetical protein